jgi:flagellar hook-associated protein 2
VIDGAIKNAKVCLDKNLSGICDTGEPSGTTDASGKTTLTVDSADVGKYPIVAIIGTNAIDADTGPVLTPYTLRAPADQTAVVSPYTSLVQSYNDAVSMLKVVSDPKSTVDTYGATMVNDSMVSNMRNQLRDLFMTDSSTPGAKAKSLRDLGISIDMTGVMTLDNTKLDSALQNNFSDVVTMMTGNMNGLGQYSTAPAGVAGEANRKLSKLLSVSGTLKTATNNTNTQTTTYKEDLTKLQTRMDALLTRYQKQFASMDSMVGQATSTKASLKSTFNNMNGNNNN